MRQTHRHTYGDDNRQTNKTGRMWKILLERRNTDCIQTDLLVVEG